MNTNPNDAAFSKSAFVSIDGMVDNPEIGLTKLEYFSAMAMQGLRASSLKTSYRGTTELWSSASIAKQAVSDAKALINELNKQQNETT